MLTEIQICRTESKDSVVPVSFFIGKTLIIFGLARDFIMSTITSTGSNLESTEMQSPMHGGPNDMTASQQEALKRVTKIIDSFVLRNDCAPFLEPVDWRGLELYDYPTIIKKPMDLGTIKRKLERNQYKSAAYCVADIRRVWDNCMTYNSVGSDFYILAKNCSKRFEDRYRRIRNECTLALVWLSFSESQALALEFLNIL
jgi:Bromodomain